MDVTVVVATFGSRYWMDLAHEVAIPSADRQGCPVIWEHGDTLAGARNAGIESATTEWVVVLDADDTLAPGYCEALLCGSADIRGPSMWEHLLDDVAEVPLADRDIEQINPLPVSSMARRDDILAAGGFQPWPAWEDWALWLTMVRRGHTYEHIPAAQLHTRFRRGSRNRSIDDPAGLHAEIRRESR